MKWPWVSRRRYEIERELVFDMEKELARSQAEASLLSHQLAMKDLIRDSERLRQVEREAGKDE